MALYHAIDILHILDLIILKGYLPYDGQHGTRSSKSNGKENEFEYRVRVRVMVFNASFNNISAISWWSVLLVEDRFEYNFFIICRYLNLKRIRV
jgi:hypothetical protein